MIARGVDVVTVWCVLAIAGFQACAQEPTERVDRAATLTQAERLAELEQQILALLDSGGIPGLSIAIANDSGVVWSRGFGVRSTETDAPVDANTVFEAASLSKPVFAYAVLQLVDQGVLDLDTPLADYYEYEHIAHDERGSSITARMVLTHTTGFPNWRPRGGDLTIGFEPGSEFSYSGEGFGYLQLTVMDLTGAATSGTSGSRTTMRYPTTATARPKRSESRGADAGTPPPRCRPRHRTSLVSSQR
jgi:CubicO group peptidase (beta-lactamase class C family)